MSDDPTKDIEEKYQTKPTIETVLERINALGESMHARLDAFEARVGARFDSLDSRLKKVENKIGILNEDVLELRGDMRELKNSLKVHEPQ
ncbi:MAG TPA: hypothetical protein VJ842_06790 [Pyrinomonadaceae bacterium]|nr:hypothetical protein [Pyrinomonadaceae bacterium]